MCVRKSYHPFCLQNATISDNTLGNIRAWRGNEYTSVYISHVLRGAAVSRTSYDLPTMIATDGEAMWKYMGQTGGVDEDGVDCAYVKTREMNNIIQLYNAYNLHSS